MYMHSTTTSPCTSSSYTSSPPYSSTSTPQSRQGLPSLMSLKVSPPESSQKLSLGYRGNFTCPITGTPLISVISPCGSTTVYGYDHLQQKPVLHKCSVCQGQEELLEKDIYPVYSVFDKEHMDYVIFAKNFNTCEIEKFIFSEATGGLVQVERPELQYEQGGSVPFFAIGSQQVFIQKEGGIWMKQQLTPSGWVNIPARPIDTIKPDVPIKATRFPILMTIGCSHLKQDLLIFKTRKAQKLFMYRFDEATQDFKACECFSCFPMDMWNHRNSRELIQKMEKRNKVENQNPKTLETPRRDQGMVHGRWKITFDLMNDASTAKYGF